MRPATSMLANNFAISSHLILPSQVICFRSHFETIPTMKSAATTMSPNEVSNNDFVCGACLVVLLVVLCLTQLRLHPHACLHRLLPTLLQQVYLRLRRVPLLRQLRLCAQRTTRMTSSYDLNFMMSLGSFGRTTLASSAATSSSASASAPSSPAVCS